MPHAGLDIPADCRSGLLNPKTAVADTDWWIDEVYARVLDPRVTVIKANLCRVVIDLNRDPAGKSLYPGQATTELCPTTDFDGVALYRPGQEPGPADIAVRLSAYYKPYHEALEAQLKRLRALHRHVVLYDAHSIRSRVPRLFDGELPVFNIGTNNDATCAPSLALEIAEICRSSGMSAVSNGRFKGGWITRHYGRPDRGVHAVQMELAQRSYMAEPDGPYDTERAAPLTRTLRSVCDAILSWAEKMGEQQ
jgi:N-formylglutamate deformylase